MAGPGRKSPFSPEKRKEICEYYAVHGTKATIQHYKETENLDLKASTVGGWARKLGISHLDSQPDRVFPTRKATETAKFDVNKVRAEINERQLKQALEVMELLENPTSHKTMVMKKGSMVPDELSFIPPDDRRTLNQTLSGILATVDKHIALTAPINVNDEGENFVSGLVKGLKAVGDIMNGNVNVEVKRVRNEPEENPFDYGVDDDDDMTSGFTTENIP